MAQVWSRILPPSPVARGAGRLRVASVDGASACLESGARDPLRLLVPRPRGKAVWAFTSSYGGGLVAGDRVDLDCRVEAGARCLLATQATTKVYHADNGRGATQTIAARIGRGGGLVVLNEPVSCFAGARYRQHQEVECEPGADLLWFDGVSSGRAARGEHWSDVVYRSTLRVHVDGRTVLADRSTIAPSVSPLSTRDAREPWRCFANMVLAGSWARDHGPPAIDRLRRRTVAVPGLRVAIVPLDGAATLVRFAAGETRLVLDAVRTATAWLAEVLDGDPWRRRF